MSALVRRFVPVFALAFLVGTLFRLYEETGVGFYRMFGTLGIVVIGVMASRAIVMSQLAEGEDRVREAIAQLPPECDVWRLSRQGVDRLVVGPAGAVVLISSSVAHYARGWGLQRSLRRIRQRVAQGVAVARRHLEAYEGGRDDKDPEAGAASGWDLPIYPTVLFLRRQPRPEDRMILGADGIEVVDVESLYAYLLERAVGVVREQGGGESQETGPDGGNESQGASEPDSASIAEGTPDRRGTDSPAVQGSGNYQ